MDGGSSSLPCERRHRLESLRELSPRAKVERDDSDLDLGEGAILTQLDRHGQIVNAAPATLLGSKCELALSDCRIALWMNLFSCDSDFGAW
jgi:hypothetical protein